MEDDWIIGVTQSRMGLVCWVPVVYTYNPSYLGGGDQEDSWFEANLGKQFSRPHLNQ
jgi:hypothetical protein